MLAAAQGLPVVVQALLSTMSPEEATRCNSHGMTAADIAQEHNHREIHDLIESFAHERQQMPQQRMQVPLQADVDSSAGTARSGLQVDTPAPEIPPWDPEP